MGVPQVTSKGRETRKSDDRGETQGNGESKMGKYDKCSWCWCSLPTGLGE